MDRFSQRENSSFENPSSSSLAATLTSSDFDFGDVFGGPPRRSSSTQSSSRSVNSGRSVSIEKAVFGDQSVNRCDFFDDIFRGDESCRSRRMSDRDQLCSNHFGTSITTAQFSLGAKLNKSIDLLPSRFSSQSVKVAGGSLLSKSARTEFGRNFEEDPKSPEASINSNPSHFSTYNWSCRRVPLVMPLRGRNGLKSKERIKFENCTSSNGRIENETEENVSIENKGKMTKLCMSKNAKEKNCSNKPESNGKIEEFVKFFTKEASLKRVNDVQSRNQSCRWEGIALNKASPNTSNIDIKKMLNVDENVEAPVFYSTMDHPFQVEFLIEELPNGEDRFLKAGDHHEAIQVSDAKIQQWSNGKQGNIRSLLSTLQYVLWAESGWKPVALVDIIEGSAVKRAYQKALLCLHPDKLQQKGAASHKRYIAQVVFDTLQEAWDHFNSIGPL